MRSVVSLSRVVSLSPPDDHQLLVFFTSVLLIIVVARVLGSLMRRIGQPAVIGELGAGLLLGPSVLGRAWPDATDWLFPPDRAQTAMLFTMGWIGVILLLVATGFETDLGLIRRLGRAAATVSTGSLVVPLGVGFGLGWVIPATFVGEGTDRLVFALFIAAALSISSLPVIAKILGDMGLMRRNVGQLTLAAAMANDVIGWIILGFVAGLAQADSFEIDQLAMTLGGVVVFFVAAFTVGQKLVDFSLRRVRMAGDDPVKATTVVVVAALTFGAITQWLHVEAVLGAFVAGVIIARSRFAEHGLIKPLETMTSAVFGPIFFATAGLRVDLGLLNDANTLLWATLVVAGASASKFIGAIAGARLGALTGREGVALGIGLNARGALEIVIAALGLSLGVLNQSSYAVVVLMAMATSMAAPPLLRAVLRNFEGTPAERTRLDQEEALASNSIVTGGRLLIPTRGGVASLLAAQIVGLVWPDGTRVTLVTVGEQELDLRPFEGVLYGKQVDHLRLPTTTAGDGAVSAVVAECRLGYAALVMGASATRETDCVISEFVDAVLGQVTVSAVVVRLPRGHQDQLPWAFGRAIVPVTGSTTSRGSAEVAAYLSAAIGTRLHLLYIDTNPATRHLTDLTTFLGPPSVGRQILDETAATADKLGANHATELRHAESAGGAILESVAELDADLLVLSAVRRGQVGGAPRFGNTAHFLLAESDTTTIVVVAGESSH